MKLLAVLAVTLSCVPLLQAGSAQEMVDATHERLEAEISGFRVLVTHEINRDPLRTVAVDVLDGTVADLEVFYENGEGAEYSLNGGTLAVEAPQRNVVVRYALEDAMEYLYGYWRWNVEYPDTVTVHFRDGADLVRVNGRPILLDGASLNCHGCNMNLEYSLVEPRTTRGVSWEGESFDVGFRTFSDISSFEFDQPSKRISFDAEGGRFVTVIIPLELLWEPYEVFLDGEPVLKHEFYSDGEVTWLGFMPERSGTVEIVGTSVVPEFGAMTVMGIAMVLAVAAVAATRTAGITPR